MTPIKPIEELKTLIPVLVEKEKHGAIKRGSVSTAESLIRWSERGAPLTEKQQALVARLLNRAKRKHRDLRIDLTKSPTIDVDALAERVRDLVIQKIGEKEVDAKTVIEGLRPIVTTEIERLMTPRKIEVVVRREDEKKAVKVKGPTHYKFQHLVRAATARLPTGFPAGVFLAGEASSGKTTGARQLAEALKLRWHFNGAISFPHEMLGFIDGAGKYHRTPFREAYEHGGVYTFDEVDRSDPVALLSVNPHLAGDVATFPDKQIQRHRDCYIVCTANTWGLGADANYSGATKLDAAFLSRFPMRISWDIDPQLESEIVENDQWLERIRGARSKARIVGLKVMIDTRVALAGAALIKGGYSEEEAASMTYLANLKPDQRMQLS